MINDTTASTSTIKTWQERTGNHNVRSGSVKHMIAEIADLRAALARAPLPAQDDVQENLRAARHAVFNLKEFRAGRSTFPGEALRILESALDSFAAPAQADEARDAAQRVEQRIQSIWEDANADWGNAVGGPPAHEIFAHRLISAMQDEIAASLAGKDKHAQG